MATELKKSTPDETSVGNGTYDDTVNSAKSSDDSIYASLIGTGEIVFPDAGTGNSAYQQWLQNQGVDLQGQYAQSVKQAQQAYAQALAANKSAYEQQLTTYGAAAENLAKSGLSASGYSDYLAGKAYAAQQAANTAAGKQYAMQQQSALQNAQEQSQAAYSEYLSQVNQQAQDIFSTLQSTGGKLSDEAKKYYETVGYSPDAIEKAETLYSQYTATPEYKQAQAQGALASAMQGTTLKDIESTYGADAVNSVKKDVSEKMAQWANGTKNMEQILSDIGYDASNMSEEERKNAFTNMLSYADNETQQAVLGKEMDNAIENADRTSKTEVMNAYQNSAKRIKDLYDRGVISEETRDSLAHKLVDRMSASLVDGKLSYTAIEKSNGQSAQSTELVHPGKRVDDYALKNRLDALGENVNIAKDNGVYYVKGYIAPDGQPSWYRLEGLGKSKGIMDTLIEMTTVLGIPLKGSGVIGKQDGSKISLYSAENREATLQEKNKAREYLATSANTSSNVPSSLTRGNMFASSIASAKQKAQKEYLDMIVREAGYDPNNATDEQIRLAIEEWAKKQG